MGRQISKFRFLYVVTGKKIFKNGRNLNLQKVRCTYQIQLHLLKSLISNGYGVVTPDFSSRFRQFRGSNFVPNKRLPTISDDKYFACMLDSDDYEASENVYMCGEGSEQNGPRMVGCSSRPTSNIHLTAMRSPSS